MNRNKFNRRREFLQLSLAGAALLLGGVHRVLAQNNAPGVIALNGNCAVFTGNGGNVLVKKAPDSALLVVDGGLRGNGLTLQRNIEKHFDSKQISTLVNTHWHPEQTGLNLELDNRRTTIFAHENTRQWLSTAVKRLLEDTTIEALPEKSRPVETFYHYGSFNHGGMPVEYGYLRQAHTDGDMFVFLPQDNVMHAGGVIASDGWPFMDWWTGGWIGGVVDAIETMLSIANDDTIIIPGNGPVMSKAQLAAMRDMYADIFRQVRGMFTQANTAEQTVAAKPAGQYEALYGNSDRFIELSHWSLIPHLTPDA